jgi:hypothetical protein
LKLEKNTVTTPLATGKIMVATPPATGKIIVATTSATGKNHYCNPTRN